MSVANTTFLRIYVAGSVINCETSSSFQASRSTEKISCKDNADNPTVKVGETDWSISGSGFLELAGSDQSGYDILNLLNAGTQVAVLYDSTEGGVSTIGGNAYVTDFTLTSDGVGNNATFDFTLTGDGAFTVT